MISAGFNANEETDAVGITLTSVLVCTAAAKATTANRHTTTTDFMDSRRRLDRQQRSRGGERVTVGSFRAGRRDSAKRIRY